MIILDTNVLSELMRQISSPAVIAWFGTVPVESVWITSITVFEIRHGLEMMAAGRRRRQMEEEFAKVVEIDLDGRTLPFDRPAADQAGIIAGGRSRAGRPVEFRDVQIAGITAARKAILATRNTRHFEGLGLSLVNPWTKY